MGTEFSSHRQPEGSCDCRLTILLTNTSIFKMKIAHNFIVRKTLLRNSLEIILINIDGLGKSVEYLINLLVFWIRTCMSEILLSLCCTG